MEAVTPEAAEACTLAVVAAVEASMAAAMVGAIGGDIPEEVIPVEDPTPAAITVLPTVRSPVTPGLGKATALTIALRDGINLHPVIPAIGPAPEPQLPPPGPRHPRRPARLKLQRWIRRTQPTANGTPSQARTLELLVRP
jgi:hypothetical protein